MNLPYFLFKRLAVQADIDLQGKIMSVKVATPKIGELITIGSNNYPQTLWWNL